ncbi:glycosyltransferase family 4 protein [Cellulomonas hominis]
MATTVFVTRKFPPSVGGMETLASDVWQALESTADVPVRLIALGRSQRLLPLWLPTVVARIVALVLARRVDRVVVGDVLLYLLIAPVLRVLRVPHTTMAMGKDVVWTQPVYQRVVARWLPRAPQVLAISAATAVAVVAAGVPPERVQVVRLGVAVPGVAGQADGADQAAALRRRLGVADGTVVLLTLGRLVRRKGVEWFVRTVLPELPASVVYVVAGHGPDAERVAAAVRATGQERRVHLLGAVSEVDREALMSGADVFVQPNIPVPGDMEGFGLVAVEAAMRGALVVAADLEGLRDAVLPGETGLLVRAQDQAAWAQTLTALADEPAARAAQAREYSARCREQYSRARMGRDLCEALGLPVRSA